MVNGRSKGQRGEREFIAILQGVVDNVLGDDAFELHRNLDQTRDGGADIEGAPYNYDVCAFEIKRQEKLQLDKWWGQAYAQSLEPAPSGRKQRPMPVLAYKQSRKAWRIRTKVKLLSGGWPCRFVIGDISLDAFLEWYASMMHCVKQAEEYDKEEEV